MKSEIQTKKQLYTQSFSEEEIRSSTFDEEKKKAYAEDAEWLLSRRSRFVHVNCPACDSAQKQPYYIKNDFHYSECLECKTVFVDPRAPENVLQDFYKNSKGYKFWNKYIFPGSERTRREKICQPRIREIVSLCECYNVGRNCFVEVGPGFGTFSEELVKLGFFSNVVVVEPSSALAASCRGKGLRVVESSVEKANLKEKADVVATFEVLEHLFSPKSFILGCNNLLNKGGLLVMTCPNNNGFDFVAGGKEGAPYDHEHINYFHPKSMSILLERCGYEVVNISTPGVLDVELIRTAALRKDISLENQPFLKRILLDDWDEAKGRKFQVFLSDNLLSGHMWVIGRKK